MSEGCPEQLLDVDFYLYVIHFRKTGRPRIERAYQMHGDGKAILRFGNPSALERWLATVDGSRNSER